MENQIENFSKLRKFLSNKNFKKILIISGKNSFYKTGADQIFKDILMDERTFIYFKKNYLPEFKELEIIIKLTDNIKPDIIIAVGGGCVMDLAKISSNFKSDKNLTKRLLRNDFNKKKIKVLAIPTTAGSGAEVTSNAVIYINGLKYSIEGDEIKPNYFCLMPELLLSSSKKLDGSAGFDAVSQAIESIFSQKSTRESISYAKKALENLLKNSENFIKKKNINNAYRMAVGANLAGKAINISKTIAPHAFSYSFTTLFGIPHGHAVSLSLNKVLKYNFFFQEKANCNFDIKQRYNIVFKITKTKNIFELDNYLINLKKKFKLEQNFSRLGINLKKDSKRLFLNVNEQRLKNNPLIIKKKDIPMIFNKF